MAALDSTTNAFVDSLTTVAFEDATSGTPIGMDLGLRQGNAGWTETGRTVVEALNAGRRSGTPIINETTDGTISGTLSCIVSTWISTGGNHGIKDFLTNTGTAGAVPLVSTGIGTAFGLKMTFTYTADDLSTQTEVFDVVHFNSIEVAEVDGQTVINASWMAYQNRPTPA